MTKARFIFHRLNDLPRSLARVEIISGLAAEGELMALVGPPAAGKSAVGILLASSIANGRAFPGRTVQPGTVVYVAAERERETTRRLLAAGNQNAPIHISGARPALGDPADINELIKTLKNIQVNEEEPIRLIVLDTAAKCFRDLDENSARDVGRAIEGLARISEAIPTALIVLLHHTDKGGRTMRGSSALLGAVDVELTIKTDRASHRLVVTKANAVAERQVLPFRLATIGSGDGEEVISAIEKELSPEAANDQGAPPKRLPRDALTALRALESIGGAGDYERWRDAVYLAYGDRNPSTKRKAFNEARNRLEEDGAIEVVGSTVSVRSVTTA
jgi:hypothetical protein